MQLNHFLQHLTQQRRAFFHFTDTRNLPSIQQHGILSMRLLRERKIDIPFPGGNDWSFEADRISGMDAYVHLSFMDSHPMEYHAKNEGRIETTRLLRVRPGILMLPGVLITDDVSNQSGVVPGMPNDMLEKLDLEVIYQQTEWRDPAIKERRKAARRYEILVPEGVPVEYILNLSHG